MQYVVPARITQLQTIDSGEIRRVQLALPEHIEIGPISYRIKDTMRPGTAFLAKPWGTRTDKYRRRMYSRTNTAFNEPGLLETFINHTHQEQADTSVWWQSKMAKEWYEIGKTVDVLVSLDASQRTAMVYENTKVCTPTNLRLEENGNWETMRVVCVAFGTGATPFLSYVRYMASQNFGEKGGEGGVHMTLVVSVRHSGQLMLHQELLALEQQFRRHFRYQPLLTRSWPKDWTYLKGRIMWAEVMPSGEERVNLTPLLGIVPNLSESHLRICGNVFACDQLTKGLREWEIHPLSVRSESW